MAATSNKTFSCPLCSRTIKVTKGGKVARHGHRRYTSGNTSGCATSGLLDGREALLAAVDAISAYIVGLSTKIERRANKFDEVMRETARKDLIKVQAMAKAAA